MRAKDDFETLDPLGTNQYGVVYKAYERSADRYVAILELHENFTSDAAAWNEIWSAVLARVALKHEYLVPVFGVDKDLRWVIMELLEGHLADEASRAPLSSEIVRTALRRVLQVFEWIHSKGAIHGNIKPATLLYDREGFVKLAFSPGFQLGDFVPSSHIAAKYLAPELIRAEFGPVGPAVDFYCLGLTALELLLGPKFDDIVKGGAKDSPNPDIAWTFWHSSDDPLPSVGTLVRDIPGDLEAVIDGLLQKRVDSRLRSAKQTLALLDVQAPDASVETRVRDLPPQPPPQIPPKNPSSSNRQPVKSNRVTSSNVLANPSTPTVRKVSKTTITLGSIVVALSVILIFAAISSRTTVVKREVRIESVPSEADVSLFRIDGEDSSTRIELPKSVTPVPVSLNPGDYECHLQKKGYDDLTNRFTVESQAHNDEKDSANDGSVQAYKLMPKERDIHLESTPNGALISIQLKGDDGNLHPYGSGGITTPVNVKLRPPSSYSVHLELEGFEPVDRVVEVAVSDSPLSNERFTLTPIQEEIFVHIEPKGIPKVTLAIDDKITEVPSDIPYRLPLPRIANAEKQSIRFQIEASGYDRLAISHNLSELLKKKEVTLTLIRSPSKPPRQLLPATFRAVDEHQDDTLHLPRRIACKKVNEALQKDDVRCEFVLVPPGRFIAGASDPMIGELSAKEQNIANPYYIAVYEVTNAQYDVFFKSVGVERAGTAWRDVKASEVETLRNHPVTNISFQQAVEFSRWLTGSDVSRLPSELEWEYAARFKNESLIPRALSTDKLDQVFNLRPNDATTMRGNTVRVDSMENGRSAEPVALAHILGNVWEWCGDIYQPGKDDSTAPGNERWHVVRGASFQTPLRRARLTSRSSHDDPGSFDIGLRPIVSVEHAPIEMETQPAKADPQTAK